LMLFSVRHIPHQPTELDALWSHILLHWMVWKGFILLCLHSRTDHSENTGECK